MPKPKVLVIDGLIAAGKTEALRSLKQELTSRGYSVECVFEPVEKWTDILALFSRDPVRWAYHFQTKILHDRTAAVMSCPSNVDVILWERSIWSDRLFMYMLHSMGYVTNMELSDYNAQWKTFESLTPFVPDEFIWLNPSIETCMNRYVDRRRDGEKVTIDYQRTLWEYHQRMYQSGHLRIRGKVVPMTEVNWDFDFRTPAGRRVITDDVERLIRRTPPVSI